MLTIQFLCPLPNGLHARPAWELKEQCSQWQSEITFFNHRQNAKADAKSSLALIGTGTLFNDSCSLNISGSDEEQARRVLEEYILVRFIDSDSVQPTQAELTAHPLPRSLSRLNPDLLYGNVLASGVGVGTLTLLQSDSLDSYRAIPASAQDSTRLEHSLATLAEQLNQQLRERDGESKTILSAHLSLIQDDEFAGNIRRLMTEQHQGLGAAIISNMEQVCAKLSASASDYLPLLLGLGLDELSMSSPRIPAVKSQLRQLDSEACRELARQACECRSAQEIEALLTAFTPEEDVRPLLALENIFVDQAFSNKEQAIQFLCGNLGVNGRTEHPFELEEDVWQREEIVTTSVGFGVAIPHTKSQWIRHSSISIARLAKPVDWQSEMGEVELVIMLTLGANEGINHVKVFSQLARKLVNKNFRQSLFAAQDAQSILTLLETELTF
ncbi:TPA: hypothetical protein GF146_01840 [Escherichia coli]|nr:hypothetical protein [Escherichia coli]